MLRSSLLVIAILTAGAGNAQVSGDPQTAAPVVYSSAPLIVQDCNHDGANGSSGDGCATSAEAPRVDDRAIDDYAPDYDYVPDYWETTPAYDAAPNYYLGVSLIPDYWGWPYYGWGWGWPYYGYAAFGFGFGWPYYGYCCYWGGYWNSYAWNGHGHHGGHDGHGGWGDHGGHDGHGGWGGDHGGHGNHDYHGPYRYMGHGQYADQVPGSGSRTGGSGDRQPRVASSATTQTSATTFTRAGISPNNGNTNTSPQAGSARLANPTNSPIASQGRFAGRAPLPSASYYAAARVGGNAAVATSAYRGAPSTNYRGSASAGYAQGRGNAGTANASQSYRVTSMPSRSYAATNYAGGRGSVAQSSTNAAQRSYAGPRAASYPQQRYAPANRAYAGVRGPSYSSARGAMPSYSGARGAMPSYSGARGAMPSYARGGPVAAPRGGNAGVSAAHSGGGIARGGHAGSSRGH